MPLPADLRPPVTSEWVATARALADGPLAAHAAAVDRDERYPEEGLAALAAAGLCGMSVPRAYGGLELDPVSAMAVVEELARGCPSTGALMLTYGGSVLSILEYGTGAQKRQWLPGVAAGRLGLSFALTEPQAGSDAAAIASTAERAADGSWRLNGTKCWIGNAARADVIVAAVKTDPAAGASGITSFLVPRDTPGVAIGAPYSKLGVRGTVHSDVAFTDARLPAEALLGTIGGGFAQMMHSLDFLRLLTASHAVGIGQAALEAAAAHAGARTTFGKRLAGHQAIAFSIADMATRLHAARLMVADAARLLAGGQRVPTQAAMAKVFATEAATAVAHAALQVCGAEGCRTGAPAERAYRDARVTEIWDGTSEIQRLVISRALLGRG